MRGRTPRTPVRTDAHIEASRLRVGAGSFRDQGVAVLGLGYVGLPLASMLALSGVRVLGVDVDSELVGSLASGCVSTTEPDLNSMVQAALNSGYLTVATELRRCAAYVLAVPTPVHKDRTADLSYLRAALTTVAEVINPGDLLVVESTIPPGTMIGTVIPELMRNRGRTDDLLIAHCPEWMMPGAAMVELVNNDRVIGGMDDASADRAQELYATFVKGRLYKTDLTTSEMVKVMENTYRDVNVALANEFAKLSETAGVNVWHAIELANHHPRVNILRPGPGVGGHCIAVDPWFLVQMDEANSHLIRSARQVNDAMPAYVVDRAVRMLSRSQAHVAVLGLSYRSDIGDTRESPALAVCHELRRRGIPFRAHDPLVTGGRTSVPNGSLEDAVTDAQLLLVVTDHTEFRNLDPNQIAPRMARRALLDARCCLPIERWRSAGFRAEVMGGFTARG